MTRIPPQDLREFTRHGVHFVRTSALHERGSYIATVKRTKRTYLVRGGHSNRYPWRALARDVGLITEYFPDFREAGYAPTLEDIAVTVVEFDRRVGQQQKRIRET